MLKVLRQGGEEYCLRIYLKLERTWFLVCYRTQFQVLSNKVEAWFLEMLSDSYFMLSCERRLSYCE